jgi:Fe-S-cluster containining protein
VTRSEMLYLLEKLPPIELERIKREVSQWVRKFWAAGMKQELEPNVFKYRALNLYCPLLKEGMCSVYTRRPSCCRMHIAIGDVQNCIDDELRKEQTFAVFPELRDNLFKRLLYDLQDGESEYYDHLGVLLYEHFFGIESPTVARVKATVNGHDLEVEKYDEQEAS